MIIFYMTVDFKKTLLNVFVKSFEKQYLKKKENYIDYLKNEEESIFEKIFLMMKRRIFLELFLKALDMGDLWLNYYH